MNVRTNDGHTISDTQFEQWALAAEHGKYPGRRGKIVVGRPPLSDEELMTVTFKAQPSMIASLDARAKREGVTRSELLRQAVERELASA